MNTGEAGRGRRRLQVTLGVRGTLEPGLSPRRRVDEVREPPGLRPRGVQLGDIVASVGHEVRVSGTVTDPKIGVNAGDVLATAGRLASSLIWVPLQKLVGKELPADGADVCTFNTAGGS